MAVDLNETRRQRILSALADGASRTWTRGEFSFTVENPQIRLLFGVRVLSVDVTVTRSGVTLYDDRVNMPNPALYVITDPGDPAASPPVPPTKDLRPLQALREQLLDTVRAATKDFRRTRLERRADGTFRGDTLSVRSTAADGIITSIGGTSWTDTQSGNGGLFSAATTGATGDITCSNSSALATPNYAFQVGYLDFDTSSIDDAATIDDYTFTLYGTGSAELDQDNLTLQCRAYNWGGTLTTADWINFSTATNWTNLPLMATFDVGAWNQTNNAANDLTSQGATSSINKTGVTYVALAMDRVTGSPFGTGATHENRIRTYMADQSGTTSDPLLVVTYTPAPSATGAVVTGASVVAATGKVGMSATGDPSTGAATGAGAGVERVTGSSTVIHGASTASGAGSLALDGSGAPAAGAAIASGSGQMAVQVIDGTGAVPTGAATAAGTGIMQPSGSGTVRTGAASTDGDGIHSEDADGTAAITLGAAAAAGSGKETIAGTGAPALGGATAASSGMGVIEGTGTAILGAATASGEGVRAVPPVSYEVSIDLDQSGLFDSDEDVSADVTANPGSPLISTERGHDLTRVLSPPLAGAAQFVLDNADGDYSAGGDLKAGREMRFRATFDATEYDVWRGYLDHPVQTPPGGTIKRTTVQCFGNLARLAGRTVSTELYESIKTGAAIGHLLDAAGFANDLRDIDDGQTTLEWWWLDNEDALSALETLKNSEGPGAALYEDGAGKIVFRGRYARNSEARSTSVQTTFRTGAEAEPRIGTPFAYDDGIKDVVNVCSVDAVRREAQALAEVWALGETVTLASGETRKFVARNSNGDPFMDAVAPTTGGGDYTVSAGSVTSVTLDHTSGAQVTITVTAGASGATITGLRLRAQLVTVQNSSKATNTVDTTTSQETYGTHTYRLPVRPEIGFNQAQDFANAIVGFYQYGRPLATVTLHNNGADERMTAALNREVGDRVRVIVGDELDQEMYVEHIRHEVFAPNYHVTTFGLTQAQGLVSYFTLDASVLDGDDVLAF